MIKSGIYKILNRINGKIYVGSAKNFIKRENTHFMFLRNGNHPNIHLQRSCLKYGVEVFEFQILEHVTDTNDLISREQHYLDLLKPQYNILKIAGSLLGFRHSEETKKKYRDRTYSDESREKRSIATKGVPKSEEHKAKIGIGNSKPNKWPCADGNKCKCYDCKKLRNLMRRNSPGYLWKVK